MTQTDRIIDALAAHHDRLAAIVADLDDTSLATPSGAADWRLSDVFSHLGSGAEIGIRPYLVALGSDVEPVENQVIWDRWNAASPREQADDFVRSDAVMVQTLQGIDTDQRTNLLVQLGFLPEPVPLVVAAGMRLNEVALHTWDVLAGLDPAAVIDDDTATLLLELYSGPLGFLLGFTAKPDALPKPAIVDIAGYGLSIDDSVSVSQERPAAPTTSVTAAPDAAVRLLTGRLRPEYTPTDIEVTGSETLDDLRRVFPGY